MSIICNSQFLLELRPSRGLVRSCYRGLASRDRGRDRGVEARGRGETEARRWKASRRPRDRGAETEATSLGFMAIRSRDRDLDKMNSSAFEPRDHGLEITTLEIWYSSGTKGVRVNRKETGVAGHLKTRPLPIYSFIRNIVHCF